MTGDDTVRTTITMPRHLRDAAKENAEHGELSERVRSLYRRIAFGEDVDQHETVKLELERVRSDKDDVRAQIRDLQAELDRLETKEARLEEKLSKHTSRQQKYEGHLESLETLLYDGVHVDEEHPGVEKAANAAQVSPSDVIDDLRERNPQIPDYAYLPINEADRRWNGFTAGDADE